MKLNHILLAALSLLSLSLTSCTNSSKGAYKHVIILGVDGGGNFFSEKVTPQTLGIFSDAASTDSCRAVLPTISAQNWGAMLHSVLPEFHGLSNDIVSIRNYDPESPYPSIFRIAREAMPDAKLASYCNWNPINNGIIEKNLGVVEDTGKDEDVTEMAIQSLTTDKPTILFLQFDSIDHAGHTYGYGSEKYLQELSHVDTLIAKIYDSVVANGLADETLFIVSCDHGGTPQRSHGGDTDAEKYVFLGVKGKTVMNGSTIVDADVRDIAATAAYALGLEVPDTWTGRVPAGIFKEVKATERKVMEVPVSENRTHATVATPDVSKLKEVLGSHNVLAYLPFDGNSTEVLGGKETVENGKLYYYDAYFGKGVALDDGYITLKDTKFGDGSFSIMFWIKATPTTELPSIIANKDWAAGASSKGLILSLKSKTIKFNVSDGKNNIEASANLPNDYDKGWMHVALVYDRAAGKANMYYDFEKVMSRDIQPELAAANFDSLELNIGQDGTGKYAAHLPAQLDEIIILSDALSESEIAALKTYYKQ